MEEFVKGCLEDPELVRLLNTGGVEVGEGDEEEDEAVDPEEELEKLNDENGKEDADEDGAKDEEERDEGRFQ